MFRFGFALGSSVLLLSTFVASACSNTADDCNNTATCDPSGGGPSGGAASGTSGKSGDGGSVSDGGSSNAGEGGSSAGDSSAGAAGSAGASGNAGAGGSGSECDPTQSPTEEACLVSDSYAVFVSPEGDDDNTGTQEAPFASLTQAVEAAAGDKLVLVCNATYDEHVSITAGARIFGGFDCADWSSDEQGASFKPQTAGPALKIDTVTDEVLIERLSFEVGDAVAAGETALTALVNASPNVTLRSVSLKAGKGQTGANGSLTHFPFPAASALNGNPEGPVTMGGGEKICACQSGLMSVGGAGGSPVSSGQAGSKGLPDHGAGQPGTPGSCVPNGGGSDGANAPHSDPATGATLHGTASAAGWTPSLGADGATGQPGQGGGGGASRNNLGHGGGGGCGGCGGNGGTAGKGGGGSIALLALTSPVVLEDCTLTTSDAGDGGNGAAGQPGQQDIGGGGGTISTANSCAGGSGGFGGNGGAGGGGAGGISVGVLWQGALAPIVSAGTTITVGNAGAKGSGGVAGTNDGIAGVAEAVRSLN